MKTLEGELSRLRNRKKTLIKFNNLLNKINELDLHVVDELFSVKYKKLIDEFQKVDKEIKFIKKIHGLR